MPSDHGSKPPCSALSHYEYYQHDVYETLDSMTKSQANENGLDTGSLCAVITPSLLPTPPMTSSTIFPNSSTSASRAVSRSPTRRDETGSEITEFSSRIPRRVQSSTSTGVKGKLAGVGHRSKRSTSSSFLPAATSVVSTCLLANSNLGGGDSVSLDPEVDMWLEMVPLSRRPFKNFHRDFADGVLMAEIMAYFYPKKVDLHNYVPSSASSNKKANWFTLNQKVFSKMGIRIADSLIDGITLAKPGYIERALRQVHRFMDNMDRKNIEIRTLELSLLAGSYNGHSMEPPFIEEPCLVRNMPGEVPDCVIYQNIKYYPCTVFDEVTKTEETLREKNNELCNKVRRLETLLNLKENHLQDLTSKIHELRGKQQRDIPLIPPEYGQGDGSERDCK